MEKSQPSFAVIRLNFIRQGSVCPAVLGSDIMFLGMSRLLNEKFEGLCIFWTVKVSLKCSCEKANMIGF